MKQSIDYKVPEGKLIRIDVDVEKGIILSIKIYGDFFVHPESAIFDIENFLIDKGVKDVDVSLSKFIASKNIKLIGFSPRDLENVLNLLR